jgi:hypothetical protein
MRRDPTPVTGRSRHKCARCKQVTEYTGVLHLADKRGAISVRNCPVCNSPVLPKKEGE